MDHPIFLEECATIHALARVHTNLEHESEMGIITVQSGDSNLFSHLNDWCDTDRQQLRSPAAPESVSFCPKLNAMLKYPLTFKSARWDGQYSPRTTLNAIDSNNIIAGTKVRLLRQVLEGRGYLWSDGFRRVPVVAAKVRGRVFARYGRDEASAKAILTASSSVSDSIFTSL